MSALNETVSTKKAPSPSPAEPSDDTPQTEEGQGGAGQLGETELIKTLHTLERALLKSSALTTGNASESALSLDSGITESQVRTALQWLLQKGVLSRELASSVEEVSLSPAGLIAADQGTAESQMLGVIIEKGEIAIRDLPTLFPQLDQEDRGSAMGALKTDKLVEVVAGALKPTSEGLRAQATYINSRAELLRSIRDAAPIDLASLDPEHQEYIRAGFRKRGKSKGLFLIEEKQSWVYSLTPLGHKLAALVLSQGEDAEEINDVTPELLRSGEWRGKEFRKFHLELKPARSVVGKFHAYRTFLDSLKRKLLAMGFSEVIGPLVESEFWNMDALFMPQFHPARNIHDVYRVVTPEYSGSIDDEVIERVAQAHEGSASSDTLQQSKGWRYSFDRQRTKRLILRSQGTALSSRTVGSNPKIPGKYFTIARCFRYDQVDASHGPDFFQVDGIVIDQDVTFKSLLGMLKIFALEVANAREIKFVPAYFPFTEPSVEIHMKHPTLGWMELGGAGIFRPEVTEPLGVSSPVIAWGLGIDRMAMVALGINDIRDLFSQDLELIRAKRLPLG